MRFLFFLAFCGCISIKYPEKSEIVVMSEKNELLKDKSVIYTDKRTSIKFIFIPNTSSGLVPKAYIVGDNAFITNTYRSCGNGENLSYIKPNCYYEWVVSFTDKGEASILFIWEGISATGAKKLVRIIRI